MCFLSSIVYSPFWLVNAYYICGFCLRFCLLKSTSRVVKTQDVLSFVHYLHNHIHILHMQYMIQYTYTGLMSSQSSQFQRRFSDLPPLPLISAMPGLKAKTRGSERVSGTISRSTTWRISTKPPLGLDACCIANVDEKKRINKGHKKR